MKKSNINKGDTVKVKGKGPDMVVKAVLDNKVQVLYSDKGLGLKEAEVKIEHLEKEPKA